MTSKCFPASLKLVLVHEGGYVNHPDDPGGATNRGVTQAVYDSYRSVNGFPTRSVLKITEVEVAAIYNGSYWKKIEGDNLPAGVDYCVFDFAVNSGVSKAVKELQRALNYSANYYGISGQIKVDGICGDTTVAAACKAANVDESKLIIDICDRRVKFMKSLKTFKTFGKGWVRRVLGDKQTLGEDEGDNGVLDIALMMARNDLGYPVPKEILPAAIGTKEGEVPGKAVVSDQKVSATKGGVGAVVAGVGVSGNTVIAAADQIKPHIDDSLFGKIALGAFAVLMLVGVVLLILDFLKKQKEKSSHV